MNKNNKDNLNICKENDMSECKDPFVMVSKAVVKTLSLSQAYILAELKYKDNYWKENSFGEKGKSQDKYFGVKIRELVDALGLSKQTVRRAIDLLCERELIMKQQRRNLNYYWINEERYSELLHAFNEREYHNGTKRYQNGTEYTKKENNNIEDTNCPDDVQMDNDLNILPAYYLE